MSLNTFFRYFGSKAVSSKRYPAPLHDTVIEPFAGSAGYAVRHHRRRVILVEKDPRIAGLWRWLTRVSAREILSLPLLDRHGKVNDLTVSDEARTLIGYNVRRGLAGIGNDFTAWVDQDPHSLWGPTLRARLAAQVERIRHWKVIEGSYELAPDVVADWFVDPPYIGALGDAYRCKGREIDFAALGAWCRSRKGQVMVCEAGSAKWLPFRALGNVAATHRGSGKPTDGISRELIWTNNDETQKEAPEQEQARQRPIRRASAAR